MRGECIILCLSDVCVYVAGKGMEPRYGMLHVHDTPSSTSTNTSNGLYQRLKWVGVQGVHKVKLANCTLNHRQHYCQSGGCG